MRRVLIALFASAIALCSSTAIAWGDQGHRVTGLVAQRLLTKDAAASIKALMGSNDLGAMALYMDKNKISLENKIHGSKEWHYDDRPVCDAQATKANYCPDGNCASTQITRNYRVLIDSHSSDDEKRFAVYVLIHLVGDIHQPLHSSDHDDAGGNGIKADFTLPNGTKRTNKLHSAWDTDFVKAAFDTSDERVIAQGLVDRYSTKLADWQKGAAASWLGESYKLATSLAYGKLPNWACPADDFGTDKKVMLDEVYVTEAVGVVPEQLAKGGARIAFLLNRAFDK
jgi:hypothetical protein